MLPSTTLQTCNKQRLKALSIYYQNPVICKYCKLEIQVKENEKIREVKRRSFCNRSCATSYRHANNPLWEKKRKEREENGWKGKKSNKTCKCGAILWKKYSSTCKDCKFKNKWNWMNRTKGELFASHSVWQFARSRIQSAGRKIYLAFELPKQCYVCGYTRNFHVAHIKAVKDFGDEYTIKQICDPSNLVALCPNHHWEFDNGILSLFRVKERSG